MKSLEERKTKELSDLYTRTLKRWIDRYFSNEEKRKAVCNLSKITIEKAISNGPTLEAILPEWYNNFYKSMKKYAYNEQDYSIIYYTTGGYVGNCKMQFFRPKYKDVKEIIENTDKEYLTSIKEDYERMDAESIFYIRIGSLTMATTVINIYYYILQSMMKIIDSCPPSERVVDLVTHNQSYIDNIMNSRLNSAPVPIQFVPQPMQPPYNPAQVPLRETPINVPVSPSPTIHIEPTSNDNSLLEVELTPEQKAKEYQEGLDAYDNLSEEAKQELEKLMEDPMRRLVFETYCTQVLGLSHDNNQQPCSCGCNGNQTYHMMQARSQAGR
jgi:hypothetical protein